MNDQQNSKPDFLDLLVLMALTLAPFGVAGFCLFLMVRGLIAGNANIIGLIIAGLLSVLGMYFGIRKGAVVLRVWQAFPNIRFQMVLAALTFGLLLFLRLIW